MVQNNFPPSSPRPQQKPEITRPGAQTKYQINTGPNFKPPKAEGLKGGIFGNRAGSGQIMPPKKLDDKSLFGGGEEISRPELREKLRESEDVLGAQRAVGLNMSKEERIKLEKSVLPSNYGTSISKNDFKRAVKKLQSKISSAPDAKSRDTIRKEVKFFKKIGDL